MGDDGEFLSFSTDAPLTIEERTRKVLSDLEDESSRPIEGRWPHLRTAAKRFAEEHVQDQGGYFTDDGDLEELDRDFVEQAKARLQNGEMLQRPLDLFDKAPVQKITYSKETALVVAEDEDQRATKKRGGASCCGSWRGGALLRGRRGVRRDRRRRCSGRPPPSERPTTPSSRRAQPR